MDRVEIHADDYAISSHASEDILNCIRAGKLDSISVLTNMSCYEKYACIYQQEKDNWPKQPLLTIHLNFIEGHCVANPDRIPHLVDKKGYFNIRWGTLFRWNLSPKEFMMIKKELKEEIKAQTERFCKFFGSDTPLRFDGHQHTQMLPIVYWALLEVIVEQRYRTEYIRVTKEPIFAYLSQIKLWKTYRSINWVKNVLLNLLAIGMEKTMRKNTPSWQSENIPMYSWGVVMSGHMNSERVQVLLPVMKRQAEKKNRHLEILFHPGTVLYEELTEEFCNKSANKFHIADERKDEYKTIIFLEK